MKSRAFSTKLPRIVFVLPALLPFLLAAGAQAQSVVYRCVDKEGRVLYTDTNGGNCKVVDSINSGTISAAPPAPRAPAVSMRQGAGRSAPTAASPASFPRVDNATQRARDDDRREILNEELRAEEKKLADLKRDFNNGEPERQGNEKNYAKYQERVAQMRDDIGRAEKNVEAIRREIANIR
jgi:HAMP domain-containing protein